MRLILPGGLVVLSMLACFGTESSDIEAEEVEAALEAATVLGDAGAMVDIRAGVSDVDSGDGVQILHIAPVGSDHRALQASVVFDRPMVPMADLDAMKDQVPLQCEPSDKGTVRWAGTSTAVWTPIDSSFDLAHAYRCTVPSGVKALDGETLEKEVSWEWETERPSVIGASHGNDVHDPGSPFALSFNHPVDAATVAPFIRLTSNGADVAIDVEPSDDPATLSVSAAMKKDTSYRIEVQPGWAGKLGPLTAEVSFVESFRTYPAIALEKGEVSGPPQTRGSLHLEFSTPVSRATVAEHLEFEPEPPGLHLSTSDWTSSHYSTSFYLAPQTQYTVRLKPGVTDTFGQTLDSGWSTTFKTGDHDPQLHATHGVRVDPAHNPPVLPYRNLNCKAIVHQSTTRSLDWYVNRWERYGSDLVEAAYEESQATRTVIENGSPRNQWDLGALDMAALHGEQNPIWLVRTTCPELETGDYWNPSRESVLIRSAYGITTKLSPLGLHTWVTSMDTGEPASGVNVTVRGENFEQSGTTNSDGLSIMTLPEGWTDGQGWGPPLVLIAAEGDDGIGVTWGDWNDGIQPWTAGIWTDWDADGKAPVVSGFVDRGIYRPGDPVYAHAMWRVQSEAGLEMPPAGATVKWVLRNPDWDTVEEGEGVLDPHGGFHTQLDLPEEAGLGYWRLELTAAWDMETSSIDLSLPIRAYREPAFRVEVHGEGEAGLPGESITSFADARYLFGSPMKRGIVQWWARSSTTDFRPEGFESFWFGPERRWWWEDRSDDEDAVRISGSETVELEDGRSVWTLEVPSEVSQTQRVTIGAEVVDIDQQVISDDWSVLVHPAEALVGIRATARIPEAGKQTGVEVVTVGPTGEGTSATVALEVVKRTYDSVRQQGVDGRWEWVTHTIEDVIHSETVSSKGEPTVVNWTPEAPGSFLLRATATDGKGRTSVAEDTIWVRGAGVASWGIDEDQTLRLIPAKESWKVGETAEILVQSPVPGLKALVTVERETVLYSEVVTLEGTAETLEIPIDDAWRPNIFVSVVAVEGAPPQDSPEKGRPQVRAGWTELEVLADDQRLTVEIRPDAELYRPRDTVEVELAVARGGEPVADAGVTLYAVDEAVLMLTAYETPDPHSTMYAEHSLLTRTADSRSALHDRAPYLTKGAADGGGGGMEPMVGGDAVRKKFVTTVAWKPGLVTGPDGTVKTSFELPDNLTTFRIMAVADADTIAFGSGEKEVVVNRPLIARPALPRGLRVDDMALAGVVVHNNTSVERTVRVEAEASGAAELSGATKQVVVGANDSALVRFRLRGLEVGTATVDFRVESGDERDAVQVPLEVERHQTLEVVATAGTTDGSVTERVDKPATSDPDAGGLTVDIGTSALSGAGSGLDYLLQYPHGCVEQTTSRGLGALMALRVRKNAGLPQSEGQLRQVVQAALDRMPGFRTASGGMAYWQGNSRESVMGTAYAVEFMGRARAAGFAVDETLLNENAAYLRNAMVRTEMQGIERRVGDSARAYIAVALARAEQGDAGMNSRLYSKRDALGLSYRAALVEAIARTTGPDARTAELLRGIEGRLYVDAASAKVTSADASGYARLWGSDELATASVLEAIIAGEPNHVLAPKLALHLAASKTSGRWANTRATAGVLAALAAYADIHESSGGPVQTSVMLAGSTLLDEALKVPEARKVQVPLGEMTPGELTLEATNGRVYYEYRLEYAPEEVLPRAEGLTVTRAATITDGAGPNGEVMVGATVDVILQIVTSVTRHDVAIIDPIPAGWEVMDRSLATTSRWDEEEVDTGLFGHGGVDVSSIMDGPTYGGSQAFDHHEVDDIEIRLYASYLPAGVHTYRYAVRATTPGVFVHPPAAAELMYEPEIFGRTGQDTMVIGRSPAVAER